MTIREFLSVVQKLYNLTEEQAGKWFTDYAIIHGYRNGETLVLEVEQCEFVEYDLWKQEVAPPNPPTCDASPETLLCDACNHGMIPAGTYHLHHCW